jgi:hypothetical protein
MTSKLCIFPILPTKAFDGYQLDPGEKSTMPGISDNNTGQYIIGINTASTSYSAGGLSQNANTLIHELLHVAFSMGYSVDPTWVQFDGDSGLAEQTNNNLIVTNCGVGTIIP